MISRDDLLSNSTVIYEYDEILEAISSIALSLNEAYQGKKVSLIPVMTGVLPFAGHLIPKLEFDLELDYYHASRYQNNKGGNTIRLIYEPQEEKIKDQAVLLLDDILDEGHTLAYITDKLNKQGASSVETAVLFDKIIDKPKPLLASYVGLKVPNIYVYGFGLDFNGIGRNMAHLYAYKN